jgi:hypothetical protein
MHTDGSGDDRHQEPGHSGPEPDSIEYLAARSLLQQRCWSEAALAFGRLAELLPDCSGPQHYLGDAQLQLRCWAEAAAAYRRATELRPEVADSHEGLARALFQLGCCEESSAAFHRAVQLGARACLPAGVSASTLGRQVRASELAAAAPQSATFTSFWRFIGDEPFTVSDHFFFMMQELERQGATWISRLDAKDNPGGWPIESVIPGARCLTMGPLEGSLEWDLSSRGAARIVAIEGNRENYLKCQVLKSIFPALPMEFVEGDVLEVDLPPGFDVVFCPGVLYHLSKPHVLLQKIYAAKPKLVFMTTQLGVDASHPASAFRQLADVTEISFQGQVYRGRLFPEGHGRYLSGLEPAQPSTWLYSKDLLRLIKDIGYCMEDHYVVDLGRLGMCGSYVFSVPDAGPRRPFRVGAALRLKRLLARGPARWVPTHRLLGTSGLRG